MNLISHVFGGDILLNSSGGIAVVEEPTATQQSILRRLCTNPGGYLWSLDYGAGAPAMIGSPITATMIQGVIAEQMAMETGVDQSQPVTTTVTDNGGGSFTCLIQYTDAASQTQQALSYTA
ncbi:phage tail protein [Acetobacter sp. DsW_063]|uniref:phage tail protein n=1 Tax=Acetobacter sp. DsW_063 TaxID=1514894 RepID=UPI000A36F430|nr:phage tail protein [Acetobacter sp. DsW_063]OUJ16484.1 tail protein [Acetobacter sp. DsW_063]